MSLRFYLAMTEAEIRRAPVLPKHLAYMACHFSPYGTGLVNIPDRLPPGSILIVNDRVPVLAHDPEQITKQLFDAAHRLRLYGVLMDFQIPCNPQTEQIVANVANALPCPVGVSEPYASTLSCPLFCAPPIYRPLAEYCQNKKGRPLWLEAFQETALLTVNASGCTVSQEKVISGETYFDDMLQCSYQYRIEKDRALFQLSRQLADMPGYLRQAEAAGIDVAIGLYQQLRNVPL